MKWVVCTCCIILIWNSYTLPQYVKHKYIQKFKRMHHLSAGLLKSVLASAWSGGTGASHRAADWTRSRGSSWLFSLVNENHRRWPVTRLGSVHTRGGHAGRLPSDRPGSQIKRTGSLKKIYRFGIIQVHNKMLNKRSCFHILFIFLMQQAGYLAGHLAKKWGRHPAHCKPHKNKLKWADSSFPEISKMGH